MTTRPKGKTSSPSGVNLSFFAFFLENQEKNKEKNAVFIKIFQKAIDK